MNFLVGGSNDAVKLASPLLEIMGQKILHAGDQLDRYRKMAADLLLGSPVHDAYNLEKEDQRVRDMYGDHICGQSLLLARRLVEAGVPVVQALCSAGDLAGGGGDNWDTHRNHFPKMKDRLLPVFDRSVSALLTDLEQFLEYQFSR